MTPAAGGPSARRVPLWAAALVVASSCGPVRVFPVRALDAAPSDQSGKDLSVDSPIDGGAFDSGAPEAAGRDAERDLPPFTTCPTSKLIGYATLGANTTGGEGGTIVKVSTAADLITYAGQTGKTIIQISGSITLSDAVRVKSDKTIEGVGPTDGLIGGGLNLQDSQNVVIRRLSIAKVVGNDAISLSNSKNVWIDHCDLLSSLEEEKSTYDGLVDIKHGSDWVTVSWTKFRQHYYTSLVGHSKDNAAEDIGHLTVTYHHNYFLHTEYYNPRVRFGSVHVFNNLYEYDPAYKGTAVVSQMNAEVLIEANIFKSTSQPPIATFYEDPTDGTVWLPMPDTNIYIDSPLDRSKLTLKQWSPLYVYSLDAADLAEVLVSNCAGTDYLK